MAKPPPVRQHKLTKKEAAEFNRKWEKVEFEVEKERRQQELEAEKRETARRDEKLIARFSETIGKALIALCFDGSHVRYDWTEEDRISFMKIVLRAVKTGTDEEGLKALDALFYVVMQKTRQIAEEYAPMEIG